MGEKMGRAPVYFTTTQVRFNPILTMEASIPAIQDKLRLMGFPDYQAGVVAVVNFNLSAIQPGQVPVSHMVQHGFGNVERTTAFVLNQNSLSLRTTDYDHLRGVSRPRFWRGLAWSTTLLSWATPSRLASAI